jgi:NAD(P)-dependent dehydrogenase (short-subunit alcohol dehydrogenase family)/acyl carrier protein
VKVFTTEEIDDANRLLSADESTGKLLVKMPTNPNTLRIQSSSPPLKFRGDACYLIAGGVGGLGQAVSTCMVENGARHFIFFSRSAGTTESHKAFFAELEAQGCTVQAIAGDISNPADVLKVVQAATAPIAGVLHMAMVLQDRPFLSMSHEDWVAAINPKVNGTMNLHNALIDASIDLDFFVMFGSISGSFGIAHQANYAAGNTFQDAFVQYRHSLSLPASVLNIGAVAGVGFVSQNKGVQEYFRQAGMPFLSEEQLFESLHLSILQQQGEHPMSPSGAHPGFTSTSQLALGIRATKPMTDSTNRVLWKGDRRVDIYRNIEAASNIANASSSGTATSDKVSAFMASIHSSSDPLSILQPAEVVTLLASEIGIFIYESMLQSVDEEEIELDRNLTTLGVDSLVTIEVRNWMRRKLEVEVSTLEMLNGGSIRNLATLVQGRLMERYAMNGGD